MKKIGITTPSTCLFTTTIIHLQAGPLASRRLGWSV